MNAREINDLFDAALAKDRAELEAIEAKTPAPTGFAQLDSMHRGSIEEEKRAVQARIAAKEAEKQDALDAAADKYTTADVERLAAIEEIELPKIRAAFNTEASRVGSHSPDDRPVQRQYEALLQEAAEIKGRVGRGTRKLHRKQNPTEATVITDGRRYVRAQTQWDRGEVNAAIEAADEERRNARGGGSW